MWHQRWWVWKRVPVAGAGLRSVTVFWKGIRGCRKRDCYLTFSWGIWNGEQAAGRLRFGVCIALMAAKIKDGGFAAICSNFCSHPQFSYLLFNIYFYRTWMLFVITERVVEEGSVCDWITVRYHQSLSKAHNLFLILHSVPPIYWKSLMRNLWVCTVKTVNVCKKCYSKTSKLVNAKFIHSKILVNV